jgi:hypothetical protein
MEDLFHDDNKVEIETGSVLLGRSERVAFGMLPAALFALLPSCPSPGDDSEARLTRNERRPFLPSAGATLHLTPLARAPSFLLA